MGSGTEYKKSENTSKTLEQKLSKTDDGLNSQFSSTPEMSFSGYSAQRESQSPDNPGNGYEAQQVARRPKPLKQSKNTNFGIEFDTKIQQKPNGQGTELTIEGNNSPINNDQSANLELTPMLCDSTGINEQLINIEHYQETLVEKEEKFKNGLALSQSLQSKLEAWSSAPTNTALDITTEQFEFLEDLKVLEEMSQSNTQPALQKIRKEQEFLQQFIRTTQNTIQASENDEELIIQAKSEIDSLSAQNSYQKLADIAYADITKNVENAVQLGLPDPDAYKPYYVKISGIDDDGSNTEHEVSLERNKIDIEISRLDQLGQHLELIRGSTEMQKEALGLQLENEQQALTILEGVQPALPCGLTNEIEQAKSKVTQATTKHQQSTQLLTHIIEQQNAIEQRRNLLSEKTKHLDETPQIVTQKIETLKEIYESHKHPYQGPTSALGALAQTSGEALDGFGESAIDAVKGFNALGMGAAQYTYDWFTGDVDALQKANDKIFYQIFDLCADPTLLVKNITDESSKGIQHVPKAMGKGAFDILTTVLGAGVVGKGGRALKHSKNKKHIDRAKEYVKDTREPPEIPNRLYDVSPDGRLMGSFKDGKLEMIGDTQPFGEFDFIVTLDHQVLIGFRHTALSGGDDVLAAGTMKIRGGQVIKIDNASGHYMPTVEEASQVLRVLEESGVDTSKAHLVLYEENSRGWINEAGHLHPKSNDRKDFE